MTRHVLTARVYYEDTDAGGVMYHAQYLAFAERGRTEALRALGVPARALLDGHGLAFVVAGLSVTYRRPLRLDDEAVVATWLEQRGHARLRLGQSLSRAGADGVAASLSVTLACVRAGDFRPARIPPPWAAAISTLVETDSEHFVA